LKARRKGKGRAEAYARKRAEGTRKEAVGLWGLRAASKLSKIYTNKREL
jgi:hypothetical protein